MKIVTKDNFCRDLFTEVLVADNVYQYFGEELVKLWNEKHHNEHSDFYFELVEDDYEPYNGYAEMYGDVSND